MQRPDFDAVTASGDDANAVRVKARGTSIDELANALDQAILQARLAPDQIISRAMIRDSLEEHFKVVGELRLAYSLRRSERDALT